MCWMVSSVIRKQAKTFMNQCCCFSTSGCRNFLYFSLSFIHIHLHYGLPQPLFLQRDEHIHQLTITPLCKYCKGWPSIHLHYPLFKLFQQCCFLFKYLLANLQRLEQIKPCLFHIQQTYICPFTALLIISTLLCLFITPLFTLLIISICDYLRELTCHKTERLSGY